MNQTCFQIKNLAFVCEHQLLFFFSQVLWFRMKSLSLRVLITCSILNASYAGGAKGALDALGGTKNNKYYIVLTSDHWSITWILLRPKLTHQEKFLLKLERFSNKTIEVRKHPLYKGQKGNNLINSSKEDEPLLSYVKGKVWYENYFKMMISTKLIGKARSCSEYWQPEWKTAWWSKSSCEVWMARWLVWQATECEPSCSRCHSVPQLS